MPNMIDCEYIEITAPNWALYGTSSVMNSPSMKGDEAFGQSLDETIY